MSVCVKLISLSVPVTGGGMVQGGDSGACVTALLSQATQVCGPIRGRHCVQVTNQRPGPGVNTPGG